MGSPGRLALSCSKSSDGATSVVVTVTMTYYGNGETYDHSPDSNNLYITLNGETKYLTHSFTTSTSAQAMGSCSFTITKTHSARTLTAKGGFTSYYSTVYTSPTATASVDISAKTSYTVTYYANGHGTAPAADKKWYNETLTLKSMSATGYVFGGWNTKTDGTGTNYAGGANYTSNAALTLYAKWTAATSTVTLNKNNGTGGTSTVTATYGSAMPSATMPTRTNYIFEGYYDTSATTGGTQYYTSSGASARTWNKTGAQTLYARWTGVTSGVTLNKNGGTGGTSSITPTYGSAMPAITVPTKTGYTFQGYYDTNAASGGTQYYTAAGASARTWNKTGSQVLYARWALITGTIYYHAGEKYKVNNPSYLIGTPNSGYKLITALSQFGMIGNSSGTAITTTYSVEDSALNLHNVDELLSSPPPGCCNPPAEAAWKFWDRDKGIWASSSGVSTDSWDVSELIENGTIDAGDILIAFVDWQMETYTITLDPNGGVLPSGVSNERTATYGTTITNLPVPTKDRHTFKGWAISYNGTNQFTNFGRRYTYNNQYSFHLDAYSIDWASIAPLRVISCTEGGGWNIESQSGNVSAIGYDAGASAYRYANSTIAWASLSDGWHAFDVVFDGSTIKLYIDNTLRATSPTFTGKIGYNDTNSLFVGAEPAASGTQPAGQYFKGKIGNIIIQNTNAKITSNLYTSFTIPASDITLEAIWQQDDNLTIDPNGGLWNGSGHIQTIYRDGKTTMNILPPTKAGSIFLGWAEIGNGSLSKHVKGDPVTNDTDPSFDLGSSSIAVYNNSGGTAVTHTRQVSNAGYGNHEVQIATTTTPTSPGLGGFYQNTKSAANKTYIHSFVAKLPIGYTLVNAQNGTGDGRTITWLTSQSGTGKYETYSYVHRCGTSGTFSTFGHVYVNGTVPVTWQLACSNIIDITNGFNEVYTFGSGTGKLIALWAPVGVWARVNNSWKRALNIWSRVNNAWVPSLNIGGYISNTIKGNYNPNLFTGTEFTDIPRTISSSTADWSIPLRSYNTNTSMHSLENGAIKTNLSTTGNLGIALVRRASEIDLDPNSWYTISCEAKSNQTANPLCIGLSYYKTDNTWWWNGGANPQTFNQANSWQKFSVTFKPASDTQCICYCFTVAGAANGTGTFSIRNCKLEKGVMATPWHWRNYSNTCTHTNAQTVKLSYCIGEHEFDCCVSEGEYQNWTICPDCGMVYVSATGNPDEYISCDICDTESSWNGYRDTWLPASTFPGITDRTEYTNIYHL